MQNDFFFQREVTFSSTSINGFEAISWAFVLKNVAVARETRLVKRAKLHADVNNTAMRSAASVMNTTGGTQKCWSL